MGEVHKPLISSEPRRRSPWPDGINRLPSQLAAAAIRGYQRWISPYKGFRCAHRVLHRGRSCSQFALDEILSRGVLAALPAIRSQFFECRDAAIRLKSARQALATNSNSPELPGGSEAGGGLNAGPSSRRNSEECGPDACLNACGDAGAQAGLECLSHLICSAW